MHQKHLKDKGNTRIFALLCLRQRQHKNLCPTLLSKTITSESLSYSAFDNDPSKHTTWLQHRYNVAATSRRFRDAVTTLMRRCEFAGIRPVSLPYSAFYISWKDFLHLAFYSKSKKKYLQLTISYQEQFIQRRFNVDATT